MTNVWLAFLAIAATMVFAIFLHGLKRWPPVGMFCAAAVIVIAWEFPILPPLFSLGGNNVYAVDVLSVAYAIIALAQYKQLRENLGGASIFWALASILLLVSLCRGIADFGLGAAMNEFRLFFYPFAALTWAMSIRWTSEQSLTWIRLTAIALGWSLTCMALFHMSRYGLGGTSEFVEESYGIAQTTRPLVSGQALVLLMSGMLCLWFWKHLRKRTYLVHAVVFLAVVAVVQQRTVWSVALFALLGVFVLARARTKSTIVIGAMLLGGVFLFSLTSPAVLEILAKLQAAAADSATYDARATSWSNLILQSLDAGIETVVFGLPMGAGFGRYEGVGRWVTFAPHNWYITIYLRIGLVGLSLFILFLVLTFRSAIRTRSSMARIAVLIVMAAYGWSYSWLWYTSIFAGWAYCERGVMQQRDILSVGSFGKPKMSVKSDARSVRNE